MFYYSPFILKKQIKPRNIIKDSLELFTQRCHVLLFSFLVIAMHSSLTQWIQKNLKWVLSSKLQKSWNKYLRKNNLKITKLLQYLHTNSF